MFGIKFVTMQDILPMLFYIYVLYILWTCGSMTSYVMQKFHLRVADF